MAEETSRLMQREILVSKAMVCAVICVCVCLFLSSDAVTVTSAQHSPNESSCPPLSEGKGGGTTPLTTPEGSSNQQLPSVHLTDLSGILELQCALLCVSPCSPSTARVLSRVSQVFQKDLHVFIGLMLPSNKSSKIVWKRAHHPSHHPAELAFYERALSDRTCLLSPSKKTFKAIPYSGRVIPELVVQFMNEKCGAYRRHTGELDNAGYFHQHIMSSIYRLKEMDEDCHRISSIPDKDSFFRQFLYRSRPVVIEAGVRNWPALRKWTTRYLKELYGSKKIHIKLTENGSFEGVESGALWDGYRDDWIPPNVRTQLPYPDLVVVRPATAEMKFADFLDFVESRNQSFSAYLEYSSIPYHLPLLEEDIAEMPFLNGLLKREHLNIWLSDGNTLGKLHFDPFDNFLCQLSGEKHVTLFEPHHNENLYEAHIPEAMLSINFTTRKFSRKKLLESTSMVMSPVDIARPDLKRFPKFSEAKRTKCVLKPGDVLFMPAFWWHEVQSYPDPNENRNLAVNFWYQPVLSKEFPCAECRLKFNDFYRQFLYEGL